LVSQLVLHTAAFWLMHGVRAAIPRTNALACGVKAVLVLSIITVARS
jgi:hypothetical protein